MISNELDHDVSWLLERAAYYSRRSLFRYRTRQSLRATALSMNLPRIKLLRKLHANPDSEISRVSAQIGRSVLEDYVTLLYATLPPMKDPSSGRSDDLFERFTDFWHVSAMSDYVHFGTPTLLTDAEKEFFDSYNSIVAKYASAPRPMVWSNKPLPHSWSLRTFDDQIATLKERGVKLGFSAEELTYLYKIGSRATHLNPILFSDYVMFEDSYYASEQIMWDERFYIISLLCTCWMLSSYLNGRKLPANDPPSEIGRLGRLERSLITAYGRTFTADI